MSCLSRISKEETRYLQFICQEMIHLLLPLHVQTEICEIYTTDIINISQIIEPTLPQWFISVVGPLDVVSINYNIKTCFSFHSYRLCINKHMYLPLYREKQQTYLGEIFIYRYFATNSALIIRLKLQLPICLMSGNEA